MNYIAKNIKYLTDKEGIGKDAFGKLFKLNRGAIGSYIDGKAYPKIETLQKISDKYNLLIDDIINTDLTLGNKREQTKKSIEDYSLPEILRHLYLNDSKFSKDPLLWGYIKTKAIDVEINGEEELVKKLEKKIKNIFDLEK